MLNELSIQSPLAGKHEAMSAMEQFTKTAAAAVSKNIKRIKSDLDIDRIVLFDGYSLRRWLSDPAMAPKNRNYRDLLYGMISPPYLEEESEDEYYSSHYYFEDMENGIKKTGCVGLAAAHIKDTMTISFPTGTAWEKVLLYITVETDGMETKEPVINLFSEINFSDPAVVDTILQRSAVVLVKTDTPPHTKVCHITPHHGKKELIDFWDKIKNSPYVLSGISTDWGGTGFIRKIYEDGNIELVLVKTSRKYALRVQTTGRNRYETRKIAKILEKGYS